MAGHPEAMRCPACSAPGISPSGASTSIMREAKSGEPIPQGDTLHYRCEKPDCGKEWTALRSIFDQRSHSQIIGDALAGTAGDLAFEFHEAGDKNHRMVQINETITSYGLKGLAVQVLLNPEDAKGQPLPFELHGHFRTCDPHADVPAGWFVLRIAKA